MKSMMVNCIVGGIAFAFGVIGGCVGGGGSLGMGLLITGCCAAAVYVACRTALEDCKWMDEHAAAPEDDEVTGTDEWSRGYDHGYAEGFDAAAESLQFARPARPMREHKAKHKGA